MTVYTVRVVLCEHDDCVAVAPKVDAVTDVSKERARAVAAAVGWSCRDGHDFCPLHSVRLMEVVS